MLKRTAPAIVAAALVGATGAVAHTTSYPSNLTFDFHFCTDCTTKGSGGAHHYVAGGEVTSAKAACVPGRKVKLYAVYAAPRKRGIVPDPELLDTDRTSERGAWSGRFIHTLKGVDHFEARLTRRSIGPQGHSHICDEDMAVRDVAIPF